MSSNTTRPVCKEHFVNPFGGSAGVCLKYEPAPAASSSAKQAVNRCAAAHPFTSTAPTGKAFEAFVRCVTKAAKSS